MPTPTGVLFYDPQAKPLSTTGLFQAGCFYQFYATGSTTPVNVYQDGTLTTPFSPQGVVTADAAGRFAPIYLDPKVTYRVQLWTFGGAKIEDTDPYIPLSNSLTANAVGILMNPQSPGEIAAAVTPTSYIYVVGDPRRYGAVGDGATDDTAPYTVATTVWGGSPTMAGTIPHNGLTYLISQVVPPVSLVFQGPGGIKQKANTTTASATRGIISYPASVAGKSLRLRGLVVDGNQANQAALSPNFGVDFRSVGTVSGPTLFEATGCTFANCAVGDIRVFSDQVGGLITTLIQINHFLGGASGDGGGYGPRFLDIADAVDLQVIGNHFDFLQTPGSGIAGKAGLVTYYNQAESVPTPGNFSVWVRTIVANNYFNNCGRDQAATQGPIDLYGYAVDATITGNVVRNFAGRGIAVKGSDPRVVISGNTVDTSAVGVVQVSTGIIVNPSTTTDFYNDVVISNNIVNNVSGYGILVSGLNVTSTAGTRQGVSVVNNLVRGAGSAGGSTPDIYLQACVNGNVADNQLFGNLGSSSSIGFNVCSGVITVRNNYIANPLQRAILSNAGDGNSGLFLECSDNTIVAPGNTGPGCAVSLSNIGGVNWDDSNRMVGPFGSATTFITDQSASFTASTTGNVMTVTGTPSGTILPGHLVLATSAGTAFSVPGVLVNPYGSGGTSGTGGAGTYQLNQTPTNVASQSFITQGVWPATVEGEPKTEALNNNTLGSITARMRVVRVDTAAAAASGNLVYINPGYAGQIVVLKVVNGPGRPVTVVDNLGVATAGNIHLNGANVVLNSATKALALLYNQTTTFWEQLYVN